MQSFGQSFSEAYGRAHAHTHHHRHPAFQRPLLSTADMMHSNQDHCATVYRFWNVSTALYYFEFHFVAIVWTLPCQPLKWRKERRERERERIEHKRKEKKRTKCVSLQNTKPKEKNRSRRKRQNTNKADEKQPKMKMQQSQLNREQVKAKVRRRQRQRQPRQMVQTFAENQCSDDTICDKYHLRTTQFKTKHSQCFCLQSQCSR